MLEDAEAIKLLRQLRIDRQQYFAAGELLLVSAAVRRLQVRMIRDERALDACHLFRELLERPSLLRGRRIELRHSWPPGVGAARVSSALHTKASYIGSMTFTSSSWP